MRRASVARFRRFAWVSTASSAMALGAEAPDDLSLAGVDLAEAPDAVLRDLLADHAVLLDRELVHVDPGGVVGPGPVGDDPRAEERLDERTEDVRRLAELRPAVRIGERLEHGGTHPLPLEPEARIDEPLLLRVDEVEEQEVEALEGPVLHRRVVRLAQTRDRRVRPDLAELVVKRFVRHHELAEAAQQRIARDL